MRLNISQVKDWQHNPVLWFYRYQLKRSPRFAANALAVGSAMHRAFDYSFKGVTMAEAVAMVTEEVQQDYRRLLQENYPGAAEKLLTGWQEIAELLIHWSDRFDVQTVASELTLEATLPNGDILYGRLDRLGVYASQLWHVQNRSLAASTNLPLYLQTSEMDLHENAYAWLVEQNRQLLPEGVRDLPYGGTIYNIVRKLKLVGKNGKELHKPDECFVQEMVAIQPGLVEKVLHTVCEVANEIRPFAEGALMKRICPATCARGQFGNSRCPYYGVCVGLDDIHDDALFMDAVDPYQEAANESEAAS